MDEGSTLEMNKLKIEIDNPSIEVNIFLEKMQMKKFCKRMKS